MAELRTNSFSPESLGTAPSSNPTDYALATGVIALCTASCLPLAGVLELVDLVMVYLVGTMVVAMRGRRGPAVLASVLGVLCFDFFFVPPRFTLSVDQPRHLVTFFVMLAVALTLSHLTLRVRTQAEEAKKSEVAVETERLRSSLLSAVSHDLKTPLAAILGSATSLLQASSVETKGRDLLENIRDEAERLSRLVHNLIETTRLESGSVQLKKELFPVEEVIGTALARIEKSLSGRHVQTSLPEDLPLVPMDAVLMDLVFVNLLENAVRHAPAESVQVSAEAAAGSLHLSVADRGPGLAAGDLERVFEKFYRVKPASGGGAGLGLAICKAVVESHGGRIWAENRPGGGAIFRLTLPLED